MKIPYGTLKLIAEQHGISLRIVKQIWQKRLTIGGRDHVLVAIRQKHSNCGRRLMEILQNYSLRQRRTLGDPTYEAIDPRRVDDDVRILQKVYKIINVCVRWEELRTTHMKKNRKRGKHQSASYVICDPVYTISPLSLRTNRLRIVNKGFSAFMCAPPVIYERPI